MTFVYRSFLGLCWWTAVQGYNTNVNDRRCAGRFVRVRERCLGAVGSHSLIRCEKGELSTKGKRSGGGLLTTVSVWREIFRKPSDTNGNCCNESFFIKHFLIFCLFWDD